MIGPGLWQRDKITLVTAATLGRKMKKNNKKMRKGETTKFPPPLT